MKIIENKLVRLGMEPRTGAVTELTRKAAQDNLVKIGPQLGPVVIFALTSDGQRIPLYPNPPTSVRVSGAESAPTLECRIDSFRTDSGLTHAVRATWSASLIAGCEEVTWNIAVENQTPELSVIEVVFPYLQGLYLGETHTDDTIVFPHHAGELTQNPIEEYASPRYLNFGRAQSYKTASGYSRELNYCGLASMLWLDYFDPSGGLYFASHDPEFILTGLLAEAGGPADPWLNLAFRKYVPVAPGGVWRSGPYVSAVHAGDWHWGARRYRSWIETVVPLPQISPELKNQHALCPRYDFRNGGEVKHRFSEIPQMYEAARQEGINHFFISGWNRGGFDTYYPEFIPDLELGTSLELAQGCEYIRKHGGMTTFYINVRLFDRESEYFPTTGVPWSLKDHREEQTVETYGPRSFSILCPDNPEVRKWYADTAEWMVSRYGARGIYLDQLGSATPLPCYDHNHAHSEPSHHGLYNQGYLALLRDISARIKRWDPDAFLMIENCGDIYGSYVFANLTWNGEFYDEFFTLFKYTFPEYVQVNMVNPRRIADKAERSRWFYLDVSRAFLLGSIFWAELGDRFGDDDDDLRIYLRQALQLRKAAAPYFASARFVDDEGLKLGTGSLQATHWLGDDFELVALANPEMAQGCRATVSTRFAEGLSVELFALSKEPTVLEIEALDGDLQLAIDAAPLSFFLITRR